MRLATDILLEPTIANRRSPRAFDPDREIFPIFRKSCKREKQPRVFVNLWKKQHFRVVGENLWHKVRKNN